MNDKQKQAYEALKNSKALYVRADDIAPLLEQNAQSIRNTGRISVSQLGYPATMSERSVKIPRIGFLRWFDENVLGINRSPSQYHRRQSRARRRG